MILKLAKILSTRLSDNPPKALYVILSEAKNLIDPNTYTFEILRLKPQNDVAGQPGRGIFTLGYT
jgi:hypothetical protein